MRDSTRTRLHVAVLELLIQDPGRTPRASAVLTRSGVARSTFYERYSGMDALLDDLFVAIADRLAGPDWPTALAHHLVANRALSVALAPSRSPLRGRLHDLVKALARQDDEHAPAELELLGGGVVAVVAWWARTPEASPEELASALVRARRALATPRDPID